MKMKIFSLLKKYKFVIISAFAIVLIGICCLIGIKMFEKNNIIKEINEKKYSLKYDDTWKIKEKEENRITLKHNSGSEITFEINKLENDYKYLAIEDFIDDLMYSIQLQNENYKLLSSQDYKLTNNQISSYKLFYENGNNQIMVVLYKLNDELVMISYDASKDYFDILLDSVNSMINKFNINEEQFDLQSQLKLEMSNINYLTNDDLDNKLTEIKTYEVANNNYQVEYSIPSIFVQNELNSKMGMFNYKTDNGYINISVDIIRRNIYEYLDNDEYLDLYNKYSYLHDEKNSEYISFSEALAKLDSEKENYIYKNSYEYEFQLEKNRTNYHENYELLYTLDKNHYLKIIIETQNINVSEKMIQMINVKSITNYASYIKSFNDENYITSELKIFSDNNRNKIEVVRIKIPNKYREVDKKENIYVDRWYGLNYNDELSLYDYDIHYSLTNLSMEDVIKIFNNGDIKYYNGNNLVYSNDFTSNEKNFKVYTGGYAKIYDIIYKNTSGNKIYVNKKIIFYRISNDWYLYIEINGNSKEITDDILREISDITIEEKNY